jgi:undecaprenyl-phosphate 4-deoxy-4-formamido-L-arabinose transferase
VTDATDEAIPPHQISVVIPVYQGESTLEPLLAELDALRAVTLSPAGRGFRVHEVVLVHDHGPDGSADVIRRLATRYDYIFPVWLSRNYGQHAATLAGMASSGGEWIATLDEDGQHDPRDLGNLLDAAMDAQAAVVYSDPQNAAPHGAIRNVASKGAKWLLSRVFAGAQSTSYQSFRLILGDVGRSVAAYAGSGVYLDVALGWVAGEPAQAPTQLRSEGRRSGYSYRRLFSHFWRMVVSSGTRGLRLVSLLGVLFAVFGIGIAIWVLVSRFGGQDVPEGWASTIMIVLLSSGATLFALGIIAEYIGVAVNMAMGKPPYLIVSDQAKGPLGRDALRR